MAAGVTIDITDRAGPAIKRVLEFVDGKTRDAVFRSAGRAAVEGAKAYHRDYDAAGSWFNQSLPTWGPGRDRTQWPREVVRAWHLGDSDRQGVTITNDHPHYRHKVYGGTIRGNPWITIPIDPRAHGRTTKQFERVTGFRLFRPRGRDVLMFLERPKTPPKTAYALKRAVTHEPWPEAVPRDEALFQPFLRTMARELERLL